MAITGQLPLEPLKAVLLQYLKVGCPESDVEPQFPEIEGAHPWQYATDAEWYDVQPPAFIVMLDGTPSPLTETLSNWWNIPLDLRIVVPLSSPEAWLQSVEERVWELLDGVWHARELFNPEERTPLAIRLTDVAAAMTPPVPLVCAASTISHPRRALIENDVLIVQNQLSILCAIQAP